MKTRFLARNRVPRRLVWLGVLLGMGEAGVLAAEAQAGSWGLSIGYNNPAGANVGGNFIYLGSKFAFEFGVGAVEGDSDDDSGSASMAGDVDLKLMFGSKWRPYLEAGLAVGIGGGVGDEGGLGLGAGDPFAGAGLMYEGSTFFFYVSGDYKFKAEDFYPAGGLGVKF